MTGRARIGIAAAVALLLTSAGLLRLLAAGTWIWPIVLAVVVSTAAGELFRRLIRPRPLVVAAQAAVVFWYDMVLLAHAEAFGGVLPTWAVFHRLGELYSAGAHDIRNTFVGGDATPGIAAILLLSLSALAVLVDALAATYAAAPLAGLPLLALYLVPATRSGGGYDWFAFGLAAAGYTALLSAEGRDRLGRWGRPLVHAGTRRTAPDGRPNQAAKAKVDTGPIAATGHQITTLALVLAVLAPVLLPTVSGGLFGIGPNNGGGSGPGGHKGHSSGFSQRLDLLGNLKSTSDEVVLTYKAQKGLYLRFQTADVFIPHQKGEAFIPDAKAGFRAFGDGGQIADSVPGYPASAAAPKMINVHVNIQSLVATEVRTATNAVPLPYPAKQVKPAPIGFNVNPENLAVLGPGRIDKGLQYDVAAYDTAPESLPAAVLAAAKIPSKEEIAALHLEEDMDFAGVPKEVVDTAAEITKGKNNPIDKATLIQNFFQKDHGFTYSLDVQSSNGADAMLKLLHDKKGFCQYYAETMVAMARSLGIPARVALGFTPGSSPKADGTYEVRTHDYHSWPELYFDGVGWLRFEPTVGIDSPAVSGGHGRIPNYNTVLSSATSTQTTAPSTSSSSNAGASADNNCPINVRRAGGCNDNPDLSAPAPKQKFSWLGWFGAVPRFLQYWLFGGSGYAIAVRFILLVLLLLACVPMVMRKLRRRTRGKLASGTRGAERGADRPDAPDEPLDWQPADRPDPDSDPERLRILAAWAELRDSATDLGYSWPSSETPRQSAHRITKQAHLSRPAQEAMNRVTTLTEHANYARTLRRPAGASPTLMDDVKLIRTGLAEPVSRRTRIRATVLPPSSLASLRERREDLTGRVYERLQGTSTLLRTRVPRAGTRPEGREGREEERRAERKARR
ncbi:MAG: transglutaminase domain-containing protein [Catenulispora sp.]|nr:transglutaminase domain-containing protein [Catenulispora sp.]